MALSLTRMMSLSCQDDIAKLQMERDDYEMDMERFQMREVRSHKYKEITYHIITCCVACLVLME
jgi:hypothetical protein